MFKQFQIQAWQLIAAAELSLNNNPVPLTVPPPYLTALFASLDAAFADAATMVPIKIEPCAA